MQNRWLSAGAVWEAASAVSVDETEHGVFPGCAGSRVDGDRLVADRLAGRCDPQLPFVGVLRLGVGVRSQHHGCPQEPGQMQKLIRVLAATRKAESTH